MVDFFKLNLLVHEDERRVITDITIPTDIEIPFPIHQVKIVDLSKKAVESGMAVGNHYHTTESGRKEFFVAVGKPDTHLFSFRWRNGIDEEMNETYMEAGDACYIPPECSHAFAKLSEEAVLWGFSNQAYDASHDVPDRLF